MFFLNPIYQLIDFIFQMLFWGGLIIAVIFVVRLLSGTGVLENEVMERWSALLPGQVKAGKEFFDLVETEIVTRGLPYKGRPVTLGGGLMFEGSPAIKIVFNPAFSCYISYEEIGTDLHLTWVLHEKIHWIYSIPIIGAIFYRWWNIVSIDDRNRLLAFSEFNLDCVRNVAETLMDKYNLDKTKLVRASSGKLGPL